MKYYLSFSLVLLVFVLTGQDVNLDALEFRNIGPSNQGGRIVDIEARHDDFTEVYLATGSGGVWKSVNAGNSWTPIFDHYETASIGDIALDNKDPNVIWVGTGEANNRNSVSWGNGIYKSTDGGETFQNMGLKETHQIARVDVNPTDGEEVCVCAIGHLWGYSGDRGLFQTKDGGKTWSKLKNGLPDDGKTGCTDLVRDPSNPDILYAAFYHRLRQPWHFTSGGEKGGIYKSSDGGQSWVQLKNGLPSPTGRIGLAIYEKDPKILMAIVEAEKSDTLSTLGSGVYRSEDGGENWTYVNTYNNRPFYYSQIRINPRDDQRVYVLTTRFMVSVDGGKTLENGSADQEVHGDFHAMWIDPSDGDRYYLGADKGPSITHDHGKNFRLFDNLAIGQFYRINYDRRTPYYVYGGLQDNGAYATASFSRDARGILTDANWKMHWGDGQYSAFNPYDYTDAYTGMENGSYFHYNPQTRELTRITPSVYNTQNFNKHFPANTTDPRSDLRFNWSAPLIMSPSDPSTLYLGANHVFKSSDKGQTWEVISPDLSTNHLQKRKYGYSGGITPDNTGAETHCAVFTLSVSELDERILWAGTDDGLVQLSRDGGMSWSEVGKNASSLPDDTWISRIVASKFNPERAYFSADGHRSDHNAPFIFRTDDYGKTWQKITTGIASNEVVRVILEDHRNPDLLFAGTETGVYMTLDGGNHWQKMKNGLPTVSVYDLKIHERENDLLVGTHGRSLWIMDDISPLQEWDQTKGNESIIIFDQKPTVLWHNTSRGGQRGHFWWAGDNPPNVRNTSSIPRAGFDVDAPITFYSKSKGLDSAYLTIKDPVKEQQVKIKIPVQEGLNRYYWNREFDAQPFSEEDLKEIEALWSEIATYNSSSTMRRLLSRFKEATSDHERRTVLTSLTTGYLNYPIPEKFLLAKANAGTYSFEISAGRQTQKGSITLLPDPLGKD